MTDSPTPTPTPATIDVGSRVKTSHGPGTVSKVFPPVEYSDGARTPIEVDLEDDDGFVLKTHAQDVELVVDDSADRAPFTLKVALRVRVDLTAAPTFRHNLGAEIVAGIRRALPEWITLEDLDELAASAAVTMESRT